MRIGNTTRSPAARRGAAATPSSPRLPKADTLARRSRAALFATLLPITAHGAGTYDILDFPGADPTGRSDSTAAWNAACNAIGSGGSGVILLPPGTYRAAAPWLCNDRAVAVRGAGLGMTKIKVTHTGTALSLRPNAMALHTAVENLSFVPGAGAPADAALAIAYPETGSWPYETTFISNVQVEGDFSSPDSANRFTVGADLKGLWQSRVQGFGYWAGPADPPVEGTRGIRVSGVFDIVLDDLRTYHAHIGVEQIGYSEAIHLNHPNFVSNTYGVVVQDNPQDRQRRNTDFNGLAFYMRDGECAVRITCVLLNRVITGYIRDTRIALGSDAASYSGINLLDTRQIQIQNVSFEGSPGTGIHSLATGVQVSQSAAKAGGNGNILSNIHCFATTSCVKFRPNTRHNVLTGGVSFRPTASSGDGHFDSGFADESGANFLSFIDGTGRLVIDRTPLCADAAVPRGALCTTKDQALRIAP